MARNLPLDAFKVFAFIGIVALHAVAPETRLATELNAACRIGVPVFFAVSGYFSLTSSSATLAKRSWKIARILIGGLCFYLVISLLGLWGVKSDAFITNCTDPQFWFDLLYWGKTGTPYHLWFLVALTATYVVVAVARAAGLRWRDFCLFAAVLLVLRFASSEFTGFIDPLDAGFRTWLFFGVPMFALGLAIRYFQQYLLRVPFVVWFLLFFAGIAVSCVECEVFGLQELYVGTLLSVVAVFICTVRLSKRGEHSAAPGGILKFLAKLGGQPVMYAYVIHLSLITFLTGLWPVGGYGDGDVSAQCVIWVCAALLSLVLGLVIDAVFRYFKKVRSPK